MPPSGRVVVSVNYTRGYSSNMLSLFPANTTDKALFTRTGNLTQYADLNVMFDVSPAVRLAMSGQYTMIKYLDGDAPHNLRAMFQATYAF